MCTGGPTTMEPPPIKKRWKFVTELKWINWNDDDLKSSSFFTVKKLWRPHQKSAHSAPDRLIRPDHNEACSRWLIYTWQKHTVGLTCTRTACQSCGQRSLRMSGYGQWQAWLHHQNNAADHTLCSYHTQTQQCTVLAVTSFTDKWDNSQHSPVKYNTVQ